MGTNFFWHEQVCMTCCREEVVHVGKRSAGWSFGFQAYRHDPDAGLHSPVGFAVESRADWAKVFERSGFLRDEYGNDVDDPAAWLAALVAPDAEQQAKEDSPEWMGPYADLGSSDRWRDAEGFRFNVREFS